MKKRFSLISIILVLLLVLTGVYAKKKYYDPKNRLKNSRKEVNTLADKENIRNGDIIFQESLSSQCIAIQKATKSKYSHCGIIYKAGEEYYVYEAVQPVKSTPMDKWIARGKNGHYVIKRLKNADELLTPAVLDMMKKEGNKFIRKNYDLTFEWSDDKIYCSELVWKIYKRGAGIEVGKLQKLKEFDLTDDIVKQKLKERYGNKIPMDETVISPVSIYNSELLEVVNSN